MLEDSELKAAAVAAVERWTRAAALEVATWLALLVAVLSAYTRFLAWVERRPGVVLPDPVLALLQPRDLSWVTFGLIYVALGLAVVTLALRPRELAVALRSYVVLVLLRMIVLSVVPLDPPPGMIPLQDPVVEYLGTGGQVLTRDLFFSGHTATMCLLTLNACGPRLRAVFLACTLGVAACVLWQAVHYTVDALAAPVFAYAAYRIALATAPAPALQPHGAARDEPTPVCATRRASWFT